MDYKCVNRFATWFDNRKAKHPINPQSAILNPNFSVAKRLIPSILNPHSTILLICLIVLNFVTPPCFATTSNLPNLGEHSSTVITKSEQKKLGKEFMRMVKKQLPLLQDEVVNNYIKNLGKKLVAANPNSRNKHFHFFVVEDSSINAFAGPDGYIGVNTGLILTTSNESELAAVMAHEIAHVTQQHLLQSIAEAKDISLPATAALIAAVALGMGTGNPSLASAGTGAALATVAGTTQHMINFTRRNEAEADSVGMLTLHRAGFDPKAMPNFFARMQQTSLSYGNQVPEFLQTHPVTSHRIADAKSRANKFAKHIVTPSLNYHLIRARVKVLTATNSRKLIPYFKQRFAKSRNNFIKASAGYGYVLATMRDNKYNKSLSMLKNLISKKPNQPLYQLCLARIKTQQKNYLASLITLNKLLKSNKGFYPATVQYAKILIVAKKYRKAQQFLRNQLVTYDNDLNLYNLLFEAYAKQGKKAEAYITRAKIFELKEQYHAAIIQLEMAKKLPSLSKNNKLMINAKLPILKKLFLEQKKSIKHKPLI